MYIKRLHLDIGVRESPSHGALSAWKVLGTRIGESFDVTFWDFKVTCGLNVYRLRNEQRCHARNKSPVLYGQLLMPSLASSPQCCETVRSMPHTPQSSPLCLQATCNPCRPSPPASNGWQELDRRELPRRGQRFNHGELNLVDPPTRHADDRAPLNFPSLPQASHQISDHHP